MSKHFDSFGKKKYLVFLGAFTWNQPVKLLLSYC